MEGGKKKENGLEKTQNIIAIEKMYVWQLW